MERRYGKAEAARRISVTTDKDKGVNPFDQPGVEAYKHSIFRLLGRAGYAE